MILVDANVLIYAHNKIAEQHERSKHWLLTALEADELIGLSWLTILAFLRITSSTRFYLDPFSLEEVTGIVTSWLTHPGISILHPTERHWMILSHLIADGQAKGPLVMDAHLAALAIEHGAVLCTTDRDFSRFKGLRLLNPLD
jgi:toxin-antitoxin system PIN domain toxin